MILLDLQLAYNKHNRETKKVVNWVSVYWNNSLMPNTILTLMYNIIKVKRRDTLNEVQTMSLYSISSSGLSVVFHIKHSKYKN